MEEIKQLLDIKFNSKIQIIENTYTSRYKGCEFICNVHGVFTSTLQNILHTNYGCEKCSYVERSKKFSETQRTSEKDFNKEMQEHLKSNLYSFIRCENVRKCKCICSIHGIQEERFIVSVKKSPCKGCTEDKRVTNREEKIKNLPKKLSRAESNKQRTLPYDSMYLRIPLKFRQKYTYVEDSYQNLRTVMSIICPKHRRI